MKSSIFLLVFCILFSLNNAKAQYNIQITSQQMAGKKVMLACYLEDKAYVQDTVILNDSGVGYFHHDKKKLPRGQYMLYFSPSSNMELIIGDNQHFSIQCDTLHALGTAVIEGSPENTAFLNFQRYMIAQNKKQQKVNEAYQKDPHKEKAETKQIYSAQFETLNKEVRQHIQNLTQEFPQSALATFVDFTLSPEIPDFSKIIPEGTKDRDMEIRKRGYFYYKKHFWDHTNLSDSTLIRTNVFKKRLNDYFDNTIIVHPDTLYNACVDLIERSRACTPMFRYLMDYCVAYTFNNKIMGMDEAFVKLGEHYYMSGKMDWTGKERLKTIQEEVMKRKYNLLDHKAVELRLPTLEGNWVSLHETKAPFILLVFWEPNCGHCKTQVPLAKKEISDRFSKYGLKVFAVNAHTDQKEWEEFIEKNDLFDFINCWDPKGLSNYRTYYNVFSTPVMYILDKDKKFIAKNLSIEQMVDLLKREYKQKGIDIN